MGRRSINTTKSGKYMNPTDQARKEARKRELKKNKKQRQMVRAAVLKGKDPSQIIMEMEKIDSMEYNVEIPPALSEKVLKDKRKKLRETLDRVMKLYEKENPEYWVDIRRMESDYEKKRQGLIEYFESVRHAQAVTVDEIPLPNLDMPPNQDTTIELPDLPPPEEETLMPVILPSNHLVAPHSILKKKMSAYIPPAPFDHKKPPGCPPTLPPELSDNEEELSNQNQSIKEAVIHRLERELMDKEIETDMELLKNEQRSRTIRFEEDDEDDDEKDTRLTVAKTKGLTNLQAKLLAMSGQDIDEFMRETEVLFREKTAERKADLKSRLDKLGNVIEEPVADSSQPLLQAQLIASLPGHIPVQPHGITVSNPSGPIANAPSHGLPQPGFTNSVPQQSAPVGHPANQMPINNPGSQMSTNLGIPPSGLPGMPPGNSPSGQPVATPLGPPGAPPLMFRPPPMRVGLPPGVRLPPGPPPHSMHRLPNMRMPPPMPLRLPMRLPGVPPGIPPIGMPPRGLASMQSPHNLQNPNVLTAGPQLIARPLMEDKSNPATIEAKPQIRNTSADVTRFLPTALRVKREDKKKQGKTTADSKELGGGRAEEKDRKPTKDDAYSQFMQEMEGLL